MLALQYTSSWTILKRPLFHPKRLTPGLNVVVRGEWMYIGKQYFDLANTISQNGYSLFNTRIGLSTKGAQIVFWAKNIANKKYIAYAYDFGAVHLGNPGTYGISWVVVL